MKRLKELRQSFNYTQEQLAAMLKTTQQSVARWESGKAEPSLAALRDLAVIFGTSVDDLLDRNPFSKKVITNSYAIRERAESDGFWGHIGVRVPHQSKSTWYPITLEERARISNLLVNIDKDQPWVLVSTLNNRMLLINTLAVKQIQMLDDNADQDSSDWELDWDSYQGFPQEIYRALSVWLFRGEKEESEHYSQAFIDAVERIIETHKLDEQAIVERLFQSRIYFSDGTYETKMINSTCMHSLVIESELSGLENIEMLELSDYESGMERYIPKQCISMLDMPLHKIVEAAGTIEPAEEV